MLHANLPVFRLTTIVIQCVLLVTCTTQRAPPPSGYDAFSALSNEQKRTEFAAFPLSKQTDFFVYEFRNVHPFSNSYALAIAARTDDPIPYLVGRMKNEKDESDQLAVLYVLHVVFQHGHPQNIETTITALREVMSNMKKPINRDAAKNLMSVIEARSSQ